MKNRMDCVKPLLRLASTLLISACVVVLVVLVSMSVERRVASADSTDNPSVPLASAQPTPSCAPTPPNMIAWLPGDNHANDLAGSFNGTLQNGATYAPGKVLQAFRFDGVNDYVDLGTSSALAPPVLTVDFWMNPQGTPALVSHPVSRWGHSTQIPDSWQFGYQPNNKIYFTTRNVAGTQVTIGSTSVLPLGQWSHVAATYDGSSVKLYINGVQEAVASFSGVVRHNTSTTAIGCKITGGVCNYPFKGLVDEVEIFDRALTPSEIKAIFAAGGAGKCKTTSSCIAPPCGMVGWWPGDAHPNSLVGSGLNGTLHNGATYAPGKVAQAFDFDGVNDYVDLGTSPLLAPNEITVDYWIYARATNSPVAHPVARLGHTGTPLLDSWEFGFGTDQRMNFYLFSTTPSVGGVYSTTVLALNQWYHVAGTYDGSTVKIYINGQLEATAPFTGALRNNPSTTAIGCKVLSGTCIYPFNGMVDELEIFNRALSQTEINAIYHADRRGKCK
jgi:hypothetical protein